MIRRSGPPEIFADRSITLVHTITCDDHGGHRAALEFADPGGDQGVEQGMRPQRRAETKFDSGVAAAQFLPGLRQISKQVDTGR